MITRNIELNTSPCSNAGQAIGGAYAWGNKEGQAALPALRGLSSSTFDVILMADVVYDPPTYLPLVQALIDLSHTETRIILAFRERHPDNADFFVAVRQHFEVTEIPFTFTSSMTPIDSAFHDAGNKDKAKGKACIDVKIFEMRKLS